MNDPIEVELRKLQGKVRSESKKTEPVMGIKIPDDLATEQYDHLNVGRGIVDAINALAAELQSDLRFEHLGDSAEDALKVFVCRCYFQRGKDTNHIAAFMAQHGREPETLRALYTIDHLTVTEGFDLAGVQFLSQDEADYSSLRHVPEGVANAGAFAQVNVVGTNDSYMVDRGRVPVDHALRIMRLALVRKGFIEAQVRFRIGSFCILPDRPSYQWQRQAGQPITTETSTSFTTFLGDDLLGLPQASSENDAQRHAHLALSWLDEAHLATDPLQRVLFIFSALEALLGDESEGLKAPALMYYRTILGEIVTGGFLNPLPIYKLYDEVRSVAVHGDEASVPPITVINTLEWNIRNALFEYVKFCRDRGLESREAVRAELTKDTERAEQVFQWLKERCPPKWFAKWQPPWRSQDTLSEESSEPAEPSGD